MHAWSEVNHDLAYKTLNGQLSNDKLRMLDGINGLVLTGEVLLSQLKVSVESRIAVQNRPFMNYFELGAFVQQYAPYHPLGPGPEGAVYRMGSLSWLLYVTRHLGIGHPQALGGILERWSAVPGNLGRYPLMQLILDIIFIECNAQTLPSLERPFLRAELNDRFPEIFVAMERRLSVYCRILAYACDPKLLALPDGGEREMICLLELYRWLSEGGYLVTDAELEVPFGEKVEEVQRCVGLLWDWFVSSSSVRARVAFGIGRAMAGNKFMSFDVGL